MIGEDSVLAVERETARYYDLEEGRENRPIDPRRVAARHRFIGLAAASALKGPLLEVGTGPGRDALALTEAGLDVIGVDLSPGHAARASSRGITMAVASARALPFATGTVGGFWSMSTLMHIPAVSIGGAIHEIARVLAPGAPVAIGVWAGPDVEQFSDTRHDPSGARRLFSRRSEERWRSLLEVVGDTWVSQTKFVGSKARRCLRCKAWGSTRQQLLSAAMRSCPVAVTKLPAGGQQNCPVADR